MSNLDAAGNSPKRFRCIAVVTLLSLCGALGVRLFSSKRGEDELASQVKPPAARVQGFEWDAPAADSPVSASEGARPEELPLSSPSTEPLDISTAKEWIGPPFLRFFAHDPEGSRELEAAYAKWRQSNYRLAEKVVQLAGERAEGATRNPWSRSEVEAALRWVGELTENGTKFILMAELGRRLFAFDRAATAMLSGQLKRDVYRDAYLGEIVEEWAVQDPEASSAWVEAFPEGALRAALQMKVAIRAGEQTPAAAAAYVSELDAGPARDAAAQTVVRQWAARDPRAAAEWAWAFPDEGLRRELLSTAVSYWSRKDAGGMQRWMQENPSDPTRRTAAELLAKHQAATE
jgi:hypothetical protein